MMSTAMAAAVLTDLTISFAADRLLAKNKQNIQTKHNNKIKSKKQNYQSRTIQILCRFIRIVSGRISAPTNQIFDLFVWQHAMI